MTNSEAPTVEAADLNGRILWSLARWVEHHHGAERLQAISKAAGLSPSQFEGATQWLSLESVEHFLVSARGLVHDDTAFLDACGYRFAETYGPVRFLVWALSEQQFYGMAATKGSTMMTHISRIEVLRSARNQFLCRYHSTRKESRLLCYTRQAAWANGPLMWHMPAAQLTESACIGNGDPYCEYLLRWYDRRRMLPILAGTAVGGAVALALIAQSAVLSVVAPSLALPILGAALGYIYELRRTQSVNLALSQDIQRVLGDLARDEAQARSEIATLNQRQRGWTVVLEEQVANRTRTLEKIVAGIHAIQESRVSTIRGFSHDLRNPLAVVRANVGFLEQQIKEGEQLEALRDMDDATKVIEQMLTGLVEVAAEESVGVRSRPDTLAIPPMVESYRRRLKALVQGRDIDVRVLATPDAPAEVFVDPLLFDRIIDNILTNAAKYTERGSIVLEMSGTPPKGGDPQFLTLALTDTGEGVAPENVERIFRPRPREETSTRPDSHGIGLSSVVRLLAQIGGRMEMMSKVGVGTTFWVHLPVDTRDEKKFAPGEDEMESMISRVVTIRRTEAS